MNEAAVELRHLRYFVAVAEELHFGRAAERLLIAQPSLSQQIRRLEAALGTDLLVRTSRAVELTEAGAAFLDRSRRLLAQSAANLEEAIRIGRGEQGRLDIGLISSAIPLGVAGRIRAFRAAYPAVEIKMQEGFTSQFVRRVLDHDIDLAVVRDLGPEAPGLEVLPLAEEPFVAVVPADHRLAGRRSIRAVELAGEPIVHYPRAAGELAHARNMEPLREAGIEPQIVQEASHWLTIIHLVGAGLGVTVAPVSATTTAPDNVRVLALRGTGARTEVQLIRRAGDDRAVVRNFMELQPADH